MCLRPGLLSTANEVGNSKWILKSYDKHLFLCILLVMWQWHKKCLFRKSVCHVYYQQNAFDATQKAASFRSSAVAGHMRISRVNIGHYMGIDENIEREQAFVWYFYSVP